MNTLSINSMPRHGSPSRRPCRREAGAKRLKGRELPKAERFTDLAQEYEAQGGEANC